MAHDSCFGEIMTHDLRVSEEDGQAHLASVGSILVRNFAWRVVRAVAFFIPALLDR